MPEDFDALVDRCLLEELTVAWTWANQRYFARRMQPPVLRLAVSAGALGTWHRTSRTLTLNWEFARKAPWPHVLEVLHHEIAHQYVDEVLKVTDETAHGPSFRDTCERIGLDPRAYGVTTGVEGPEGPAMRRVRKLLALAESPNQHEAEAAMKAAQRMMLQYNLDLRERQERSGYTVRHLGTPRARHAAWEKLLVGLLSAHFFVTVVWVPAVDRGKVHRDATGRSTLRKLWVPEALGTPENLEIAEYVRGFLTQTGERLWRAHKRETGLKADRERARFLAGVMVGFRQKLAENQQACTEAGLVWVGDDALDAFKGRRFPRLVSGAGVSLVATPEFRAGQAAGQAIVLHKPIRSGPSGPTGLLGG